MKAKTTELFQDALKFALKGKEDATREYLNEYENRMAEVSRQLANLKRDYERLNDEHTAICVVFGANKK